jgi:hypothetical protein
MFLLSLHHIRVVGKDVFRNPSNLLSFTSAPSSSSSHKGILSPYPDAFKVKPEVGSAVGWSSLLLDIVESCEFFTNAHCL